MASYYDDNYGWYDGTEDPEVVEWYHRVQEESVKKKCEGCGRIVRLRPNYRICNSCADKRERGMDI